MGVAETKLPIVVGVDGSEQSELAIRYAVADARRRGTGVTVVHAVHETAPMTAMLPLVSVEAFTEVGQRLVEDGERLVSDLDPDLEVGSLVKAGPAVHVLVSAGEHASAVVLGHRTRSTTQRVLSSSTASGVAARAHCPVVSVPQTWVEGAEHGRVVVGLDDSAAARDALALAFAEASVRKAGLTVLHAWRLPVAYEDVESSRLQFDDWMSTASEQIDRIVAPWREVYPDVAVEIDLRHDYAAPALVAATKDADLVVVGRRGHGAPMGLYLGSLARTLIREAHCPVEVAPQHGRHQPPPGPPVTADEVSPQD